MAMSLTQLEDELKALALYDNESDAIRSWAGAFADYFQGDAPPNGAISNGVFIVPAAIPPAEAAMVGAMTGLADPGQGAVQIAAGITAFWGALIPATAWPTTTVITPPVLLAGLAAALQAVFATNQAASLDKDPAMEAIAGTIHTNNQGGTATWPVLGPQPIT